MNKNTVYILQKDLPHVKAGTEFSQENNNPDYYNANFCHYHDRLHKSRIINNPTWFKPKEEVNESKPTEKKQWEDEDDDFLWTNELVMEFVNFHEEQKGIHWLSEDIEKFKKEKSKKGEPQWEILSLKYKKNGEIYPFTSTPDENFEIYSVKRFPDNTVWSVDDDTQHGKISGFKIAGSTMIAEIKNTVFPYDYPLYLSELKAPKEEQVQPHKCKYCGIMVTSDSDEGCYANPNKPVDNIGSAGKTFTAPESLSQHPMCKTEEQVPIKVESIAFYTSFGEKQIRDTFAVNLSNNISEDKLQPIKKAIQSVINNDGLSEYFNKQPKLYSESELLQARRDAFDESRIMFRIVSALPTEPQFKHLTFEDYINSLK